jgi:hypothetical protein
MWYLDNIYIICRIYNCNRIGGVMVDRVKSKTMKLVFVVSPCPSCIPCPYNTWTLGICGRWCYPLECVILCCTVIIFLPRSSIFSKPLLTKKFWVYYGSVKQAWQECSLNGFRSIWKFNMTLEPIIIDNISIFDDKSLI